MKAQYQRCLMLMILGYALARLVDVIFAKKGRKSIALADINDEYKLCMLSHPDLQDEDVTWNLGVRKAKDKCYRFGALPAVVSNKDEKKSVIWLKNPNRDCVFVTLGIGQDVTAEAQIKPNCNFFGADPIDEGNKAKYEEVGRFFNYAVGATARTNSSVLHNGKYGDVTELTAMPFYDFLNAEVKRTVVEYLFVDVEYAEYDMFPLLQARKAMDNGFVFCQINLEVHRTKKGDQKSLYFNFIRQLLQEGAYVLTADDMTPSRPGYDNHHRLFFYNSIAPECVERFF